MEVESGPGSDVDRLAFAVTVDGYGGSPRVKFAFISGDGFGAFQMEVFGIVGDRERTVVPAQRLLCFGRQAVDVFTLDTEDLAQQRAAGVAAEETLAGSVGAG